MSRPRLLDLFCGAGGAAMGYHRAGFDVFGIDLRPQPHYPFPYIVGDALDLLACIADHPDRWSYVAVHASPPCQAFSRAQQIRGRDHPDLIGALRGLLRKAGRPYVIENVPGAPLIDPVVIEGQMFPELRVHRARWFETDWPLTVPFLRPPPPKVAMMGRPARPHEVANVVGHFAEVELGRRAMGIDWMTRDELADAIPPAYTELIGEQLLDHLERAAA